MFNSVFECHIRLIHSAASSKHFVLLFSKPIQQQRCRWQHTHTHTSPMLASTPTEHHNDDNENGDTHCLLMTYWAEVHIYRERWTLLINSTFDFGLIWHRYRNKYPNPYIVFVFLPFPAYNLQEIHRIKVSIRWVSWTIHSNIFFLQNFQMWRNDFIWQSDTERKQKCIQIKEQDCASTKTSTLFPFVHYTLRLLKLM